MEFFKEHVGFILTLVVTYVLGISLVAVQYLASDAADKNLLQLMLESLVPTTITYVLGCVLVNLVELIQNNSGNFVFNLFACIFVMLYAIIFCMYLITGFSVLWALVEGILTAGLLYLNVLCYKEKFDHRNHGLI